MINATNNLVIIDEGLFPVEFKRQLDNLLQVIVKQRGEVPPDFILKTNPDLIGRHSFQYFINQLNFNQEKLIALYHSLYVKKLDMYEVGKQLKISFPSEKHFRSFKGGCGLLFLWLWGRSKVLLTWHIDKRFLSRLPLDHTSIISNDLWKFLYSEKTFSGHTHRFLLMTDWSSFSDVSLEEIWDLIRSGFRTRSTRTNLLALPKAIINHSDCQFSEASLRALETLGPVMSLRANKDLEQLNVSELTDYYKNSKAIGKSGKTKVYGDKVYTPTERKLRDFQQQNKLIEYIKLLPSKYRASMRGEKWYECFCKTNHYPGRGHINIEALFPDWISALKHFDANRIAKGHSFTKNRVGKGHLIILFDYVFLYLPWYQEINSHPHVQVPYKVSDFKRWAFWSNEPLKQAEISDGMPPPPLTVKEFYKLRRSQITLSGFINTCSDFFEYLITEHSEKGGFNTLLVEPSFSNPVKKDYDKEGSGKRRPTDKVAFPRKVIPFVLDAFDEFERVNHSLQQSLLNGTINENEFLAELLKNEGWISPTKWNEKFEIKLDKKTIAVDSIPCLMRLISLEIKGQKKIFAFNSVFRMLRTTMHVGNRMQSTQWLDITNFDQRSNNGKQYFQNLFVTVDKTEPYKDVVIPSYVFGSLVREKTFQLEQLPIQPYTVPYEGNVNDMTYPDGITPLFNNPKTNKPFDDSEYQETWLSFIMFLEREYNKLCRSEGRSEDCHRFYYIDCARAGGRKNNERAPKTIETVYTMPDGTEYTTVASEIVYRPVHTPHSMRGTYTVMRRFRVRNAVLMEQQGWSEEQMVEHYATSEHSLDKLERLEAADRSIRKGVSLNDITTQSDLLLGKGGIKPSERASAMKEALNSSVNDAINSQRLISISIPDLGEYKGKDGIEIFKSTQSKADVVVFDHCICPVGGICPVEVLEIITEQKRCAICPIAMFGLDNIPALKAKARDLDASSKERLKVLENVIAQEASQEIIESIDSRITHDRLEVSACVFIVNMLEQKLVGEKYSGDYVCRDPDMLENAFKISLDTEDEIQSFVSRIIDAKNFPQFTSGNFLAKVELAARRFVHGNHELEGDEISDIDLVAAHIAAIMKKNKLTIKDLSTSNLLPELKGY